MAKVVSEKMWLRFDRREIEQMVVNYAPEGLDIGDFEVVEVTPKTSTGGHIIDELTIGIRLIGPLHHIVEDLVGDM